MVTRRDMGVSFAPAKRAAVWPRPSREPGRWPMPAPLPLPPGRRTADLPLLAFPACLSTLETKPWPRFFGALGRMRKSSSRRLVMAGLPASSGVSGRAKHVDMTASARASRPKRHGGKAAPCRATHVQTGFRRGPVPRPVLPSAFASRIRSRQSRPGGAAAPAASAPANADTAAGRARSRQDACTLDGCAGDSAKCGANAPALHARRHGDDQQDDTPDGTMRCMATCSESTAIMGGIPARSDARRRSRRMR